MRSSSTLRSEALKLALHDRDKYLGDTDFIRIPFPGLLSKAYAAERRKLIDPDRSSTEFRPVMLRSSPAWSRSNGR